MQYVWKDDDRLLSGRTVDRLLDACRSRKYALMKRPFDPFPQPCSLGRSSRWLANDVYIWLARQIGTKADPAETVAADVETTKAINDSQHKLPTTFELAEAKRLYESGRTLDSLCRDLQVGKGRLHRLLQQAGTQMRPPGRKRPPAPTDAEITKPGDSQLGTAGLASIAYEGSNRGKLGAREEVTA